MFSYESSPGISLVSYNNRVYCPEVVTIETEYSQDLQNPPTRLAQVSCGLIVSSLLNLPAFENKKLDSL